MTYDIRIQYDEDDRPGVQKLTIEALNDQGAIDIEMELPRIIKLLERDWLRKDDDGA